MKTKPLHKDLPTFIRKTILLAITALAVCASPSSRADALCNCLTIWNGGTGNWFTAANWSTQVPSCTGGICPPLAGPVEAQINNGSAQITGPTPTASVCQLFFGYNNANESGALSVNHGTLNMCNQMFVGWRGKGALSITNGGVVSTPVGASIASQTGSSGAVTVDGQNQDGTKSHWTISAGELDVGGTRTAAGGIGLLTVTNSAFVTATSVHVYPSGTLTGNSSVSATSGTTIEGTIEPSGGRLTIGGDLTFAGSSPLMECNVVPASADNVDASGTASLIGRLKVTMTGTFTPGTTYTLLHANVRNGTFSSLSITFPPGQGWSPQIIYDANNVKLNLVPTTAP